MDAEIADESGAKLHMPRVFSLLLNWTGKAVREVPRSRDLYTGMLITILVLLCAIMCYSWDALDQALLRCYLKQSKKVHYLTPKELKKFVEKTWVKYPMKLGINLADEDPLNLASISADVLALINFVVPKPVYITVLKLSLLDDSASLHLIAILKNVAHGLKTLHLKSPGCFNNIPIFLKLLRESSIIFPKLNRMELECFYLENVQCLELLSVFRSWSRSPQLKELEFKGALKHKI